MATDATGTPTTKGIPKYNTANDAPSGRGFNAAMDAIDTLLDSYVPKPSGIATGEVPVWNGTTWVRSSVTRINTVRPQDLASDGAGGGQILYWDGAKWAPGAARVAPTFVGMNVAPQVSEVRAANTAYLMRIQVDFTAPFTFTRYLYGIGTSSGNIDLGVYYSDDESTFTRLTSTGSFAAPAAASNLVKTVATQTLTPVIGRRWFVAIAPDNATVSFRGGDNITYGVFSKATSFPLPATLTGMTAVTTGNHPVIGLAV